MKLYYYNDGTTVRRMLGTMTVEGILYETFKLAVVDEDETEKIPYITKYTILITKDRSKIQEMYSERRILKFKPVSLDIIQKFQKYFEWEDNEFNRLFVNEIL